MSEDPKHAREFLGLYAQANGRLNAFTDSLTEWQLSVPRDAVGWAVKDHIVHLAVWQTGITALLRLEPRWPAMGLTAEQVKPMDFDGLNDVVFKQHRDKSAADVLAMHAESSQNFLRVFATLHDDDLAKPYAHFQPDAPDRTQPIVGWLAGDTYAHIADHIVWMKAIANQRVRFGSGAPWEDAIGYSRVTRVGNVVEVSGTAAVDEHGQTVGVGDAYAQEKFVLQKIERALAQAGASLKDVVRTRTYVTDASQFEAVGRAHGEAFGDVKPAATMLQVSALIAPELLTETEVTAIVTA